MAVPTAIPSLFHVKMILSGRIWPILHESFQKCVGISIAYAMRLEVNYGLYCRFHSIYILDYTQVSLTPSNETYWVYIFTGQIENPVTDITPTYLTTLVISTLREVSYEFV